MTPKTRYGILDDFGQVIRWQWSRPSRHYRYVIDRLAKNPPAVVERAGFEAPF